MDSSGPSHPINPYNFPAKLWCLVNTPEITAVTWNRGGDGILIDQALIETQVLSPTSEVLKKLSKFRGIKFLSFVRQLHHYGFRKVQPVSRSYPSVHHFYNPSFKQNRPDLLPLVNRQVPRQRRQPPAVEATRTAVRKKAQKTQKAQKAHGEIVHQQPTQAVPVNTTQPSTRAVPGMPPGAGRADTRGPGLGFDLLRHPYQKWGFPVLHFNPGSANPGRLISNVLWNQPADQCPRDPARSFEPKSPVFQPEVIPATATFQRNSISSMSMPNTNRNTLAQPREASPQEFIEDPYTELNEMLLLVSNLMAEARTRLQSATQ